MKTLIATLTAFVCVTAAAAIPPRLSNDLNLPGGVGTFSEGYRMGQLIKFSTSGLLVNSGEGELLMGRESTPVYDPNSGLMLNPWQFSTDLTDAQVNQKLLNAHGQYVVIRYGQPILSNPFTYDTPNRALDVYALDHTVKPPKCTAPASAGGGSYSNGVRIGRFVKVSRQGAFQKSYETLLQIGNAGSHFKRMSILDDDLADCALQWLFSGRRVKITYNQSVIRNPFARDTTYSVMEIEEATTANNFDQNDIMTP